MAWETRTGRTYFYRKVREGGRIRSVYLGRTPEAEAEAARIAKRNPHAETDAQFALLDELCRLQDEDLYQKLEAAGFHNANGRGWRRVRGFESQLVRNLANRVPGAIDAIVNYVHLNGLESEYAHVLHAQAMAIRAARKRRSEKSTQSPCATSQESPSQAETHAEILARLRDILRAKAVRLARQIPLRRKKRNVSSPSPAPAHPTSSPLRAPSPTTSSQSAGNAGDGDGSTAQTCLGSKAGADRVHAASHRDQPRVGRKNLNSGRLRP